MGTFLLAAENQDKMAVIAFIIIAAIVVLVCAGIIIYLSARHRWAETIKNNSARLAAIRAVNGRYSFFTVERELIYTRTLKSKQQLDNFNFSKNISQIIEENYDYYSMLVKETERNIQLKSEYNGEIARIPDFIDGAKAKQLKVPYGFCCKKEAFFCSSALLEPVLNPRIVLRISYTSPAGRNHYSRKGVSEFKDIKGFLRAIDRNNEYKESKEYQRKAMTPKLRYEVFKRDNFRCQICGRGREDGVKLHVDHIKPVSKGGKTELSNLRTLCEDCNLGKGAKYDENGSN